jgi:hypothetical protein
LVLTGVVDRLMGWDICHFGYIREGEYLENHLFGIDSGDERSLGI